MYYPTGKTTEGRKLVVMNECQGYLSETLKDCSEACVLECLGNWMNENECCAECSDVNQYLKECGWQSKLNEDGSMAPADGAPAAGYNTLGNVNGMGNPVAPSNDGTNAGFYNPSKVGSGDKFTSLSVGTGSAKKGKKARLVKKFQEFMGTRKKV
jgi:hypothetical protein